MTIETSWLGRENRFSRQIHRLTASLLVLGAAACGAPVAQEPGAPMAYIEPPPIVASIDRDAFARFAQGLESGSGVEPADIRVNLPILGLSVPRSGLESAPEMTRPQQDYAADQTGYWYAQVTETPFGHLVTRGSLLRVRIGRRLLFRLALLRT